MRASSFTVSLFLSLAWTAAFGFAPGTAQANGQPSFVAGDLIVKFTATSAPGALVTRAMQGDPDANRRLATWVARLSQELGVVVAVVRVTSGSELVLSVDRDRLAQSLREVVRRDPAVRRATRIDPPKTVLPAARIELALVLRRDSEAGKLVRQTAQAGRDTSSEVELLVRKLCVGAEPQPSGRVSDRGQLVLAIDMAAFTLDLVERLKRRPDVEYAQVSHVVKPYPGVRPGERLTK